MTGAEIVTKAMAMLNARDRDLLAEIIFEEHEPYTHEDVERALDVLRARKIKLALKDTDDLLIEIEGGKDHGASLAAMLSLKRALVKSLRAKGESGRKLRKHVYEVLAACKVEF